MNVGNILRRSAFQHRNLVAVSEPDRQVTFRDLDERASRLANALIGMGLGQGANVGVMLHNSIEYVEALFGIARAGMVSVHIGTKLTGREAGYIAQDAGLGALIIEADLLDRAELLAVVGQKFTIVKGAATRSLRAYEAVLAAASGSAPDVTVSERDPFFIGYTSGTTGQPKGALISHRSRVLTSMVCAMQFGLNQSDTQLMITPMYHGAPMIFTLISVLSGGRLHIPRRFDAELTLRDIQEQSVTSMFVVPTILRRILSLPDAAATRYATRTLRTVVSNAAALPTETKHGFLDAYPHAALWEAYGSTEASWVTALAPWDQRRMLRSCGQPLPLNDLLLLDEHGNEVGVGEVGELYSRSPFNFEGYLNNPGATRECMHGEYLSAGDLAMRDEENFYYIMDRKKEMIISGGVNIYPREIEDVLHQHPKVQEAAVVGMPDPEWGEAGVAVIVAKPGATVTAEELAAFCSTQLAAYKKPRRMVFAESVPRNPSGKIQKKLIKEWLVNGGLGNA